MEGNIVVEKRLFDTVLDYLTNTADTAHHEERQQVFWVGGFGDSGSVCKYRVDVCVLALTIGGSGI